MKQIFLRFCAMGVFMAVVAFAASPTALADYYNYYGSPTLSQSNISLAVNQSVNITISGGSLPYTMYYSAPNLFQAVISGNTLQIIGLSTGAGSLNVCSSGGSTSGCATVYVTVGGSNYNYGNNYYPPYQPSYPSQQISLGQTSITLANNTPIPITIYGNGSYYISSNSNPNIATAYLSGNTMNVTGLNSGNTTIIVCQNSGGQCATLYVTVTYNGVYNYNNPVAQPIITFSQTNPVLSVGQSLNVSLYGGANNSYSNSGYYYIGYNSSSNSLQATISGSNLSLQGLSAGNVGVVVCSSSTNCAALTVVVGSTIITQPNSIGNWYSCADENQFCSFSGTRTVQYGANGAYVYKTLTNGTVCSNAVFGDPIFGVAKRCSISY